MRQHGRRVTERHGALRSTVAALMVSQAGEPGGPLLDPCCGSGTILTEALAVGWPEVRGTDIDPDAVSAASDNVPKARIELGDARNLGLPPESVQAVVSNFPFGRQHGVSGDMTAWLTAVLAEISRVTGPGGRVVTLAPSIPERARPGNLTLVSVRPLRLLGARTMLWVFERGNA